MKSIRQVFVDFQEFFEMRELDHPRFGKMRIGTSFYDIPEKLVFIVEPRKVKVEIRYISEETTEKVLSGDEPVRLRYGKKGGRVYKILIDVSRYKMDADAALELVEEGCRRLGQMFPRTAALDDPTENGLNRAYVVLLNVMKKHADVLDEAIAMALEGE